MTEIVYPVRLGSARSVVPSHGYANARVLLDATGRIVVVADSDLGPAVVGPLDEERLAEWIAADRAYLLEEEEEAP